MKKQTFAPMLGVAVFGVGLCGAYAMSEREQEMLYKTHHREHKVEWSYSG